MSEYAHAVLLSSAVYLHIRRGRSGGIWVEVGVGEGERWSRCEGGGVEGGIEMIEGGVESGVRLWEGRVERGVRVKEVGEEWRNMIQIRWV